MKIISPRGFDPALMYTDLPITENPWAAGEYIAGQRAYLPTTYDLYECLTVTKDDPAYGDGREAKTWAKIGKINKYACFDGTLEHTIKSQSSALVTVQSGNDILNGIAIFGLLSSGGALLTVETPQEGLVYSKTFNAVDGGGIKNWYDFFFSPVVGRPDHIFLDLPPYTSATIRIYISGPFSLGEVIVGYAQDIGGTRYGVSGGILDFSRKDRDAFGRASLLKKAFAKRINYNVYVPTPALYRAYSILEQTRATPAVFIGSIDQPTTWIYGFYKDFQTTLTGPDGSDLSIDVEGLI